MSHPRTIVIAGGSGFIGQLLATHFTGVGDHVHILTRGSHRDGTNGASVGTTWWPPLRMAWRNGGRKGIAEGRGPTRAIPEAAPAG